MHPEHEDVGDAGLKNYALKLKKGEEYKFSHLNRYL